MTPPDPNDPIALPPELARGLVTHSILTTYWPTVIMLVIAAALVTWWALRRKRSRHRVARGVALWGSASLSLVLAIALAVNTWVGFVPTFAAAERLAGRALGIVGQQAPEDDLSADTTGTPVGSEDGRITTATQGGERENVVHSTAAGVPDSPIGVYLPPDYDRPGNTTRYPTYYLLPGAPGTGQDWWGAGNLRATLDLLIASGYLPPCLVVTPDLSGGLYSEREPADYPGNGPQLETHFFSDVIPWVDANLRTIPDREHRIIAGMSAGGKNALDFALHREGTFAAVGAIMAYTRPYTPDLLADPTSTERYSTLDLIAQAGFPEPLPVYLAQGDRNRMEDNLALKRALANRGQPVHLDIYAGQVHNWTMARDSLPYALIWTARQASWIAAP